MSGAIVYSFESQYAICKSHAVRCMAAYRLMNTPCCTLTPCAALRIIYCAGCAHHSCPAALLLLLMQLMSNGGPSKISKAIVGQEAVMINIMSGGSPLLKLTLFGCAQAYIRCAPDHHVDIPQVSTPCPTKEQPIGLVPEGDCPGSGGVADWVSYGPAVNTLQQVHKAGLQDNQVVSVCGPSNTTSCHCGPQGALCP